MKNSGQILVEVLVAMAILGIILTATSQLFLGSLQGSVLAKKEVQADLLLQEYLEAIRSVREQDWNNLQNGRFYLHSEEGVWSLVTTPDGEKVGEFTRWLEIGDVYRNNQGQIVTEAGQLDPSSKRIASKVSWQALVPREASAVLYLTRYLDNLTWTQTTKEEFEQGEMELTKILDPAQDDGEVILRGGCFASTPEALIYDDQLRNGWRVNCEGFDCRWGDWRCWLKYWICRTMRFFSDAEIDPESSDYTYDGSLYSIRVDLKPYSWSLGWSWVRLYNFDATCTKGFKNLHFYAYNPSDEEIEFYLTAIYGQWETTKITLPPGGWEEISIDYDTLEDYENNLESLYFHKWTDPGDSTITFYLDQIELTGGVGGYFTQGTLASSVFDTESQTSFNRIEFTAEIPFNTSVGFQAATSDFADGPWIFYGPGGTINENDLYSTPEGEGIWLGNSPARFLRYKAYLKSDDGESTPILKDVTINYSP